MFQSRLSVKVRLESPAVAVIQVWGEINMLAENMLMDAFEEAAREQVQVIVLNFSTLDYMNSAGIGLLVTMLMRANRKGLRLVACCLNHHYREIFSITRLDEVIAIYPDETQALQVISSALRLPVKLSESKDMSVSGGK